MLHDRVTSFGSGVDQTTKRISRTYEVRGMLAKVSSHDHATPGSGNVLNEVLLQYNDFGQLIEDYQAHAGTVNTGTTPKVGYAFANGAANHVRPMSMTYPNSRQIDYDYGSSGGMNDVLSRVAGIKDGASTLAGYLYMGLGTVVREDYPQPEVRLDLWGGTSEAATGCRRS